MKNLNLSWKTYILYQNQTQFLHCCIPKTRTGDGKPMALSTLLDSNFRNPQLALPMVRNGGKVGHPWSKLSAKSKIELVIMQYILFKQVVFVCLQLKNANQTLRILLYPKQSKAA